MCARDAGAEQVGAVDPRLDADMTTGLSVRAPNGGSAATGFAVGGCASLLFGWTTSASGLAVGPYGGVRWVRGGSVDAFAVDAGVTASLFGTKHATSNLWQETSIAFSAGATRVDVDLPSGAHGRWGPMGRVYWGFRGQRPVTWATFGFFAEVRTVWGDPSDVEVVTGLQFSPFTWTDRETR